MIWIALIILGLWNAILTDHLIGMRKQQVIGLRFLREALGWIDEHNDKEESHEQEKDTEEADSQPL